MPEYKAEIKRRFCAHRGFNTAAPENTLPAFAAAVSLGAEEIEFDLWPTRDGDMVVCHDQSVDRTTDSRGRIPSMTTAEVRACDAGVRFSPQYAGTRIPLFEEVLEQFANRVVMNIHIKSLRESSVSSPEMARRGKELFQLLYTGKPFALPLQFPTAQVIEEMEEAGAEPYEEHCFEEILRLIDRYHCRDSVYITGEKDVLITARRLAPDISRCCLEGHMNFSIVENALKYECSRVQFCKTCLTPEMIRKAHDNRILCNLFWSDDPQEAEAYLDAGIDVILTNDYLRTRQPEREK